MTIIYFILILGIVVLIHEFGHFIFAKKAGIYVYEFSIGMGPQLFKFHRKNDETEYSIRLLPIGGYVQMAGEDMEEEESDIPKEKQMTNKKWYQRFLTIIAGILFNFLLAIVIFFIVGLVNGVPTDTTTVAEVTKDSAALEAGLQSGDVIEKINGKTILSSDHLMLLVQVNGKETMDVVVDRDGKEVALEITPKKVEVDDQVTYQYGFSLNNTVVHNFFVAVKYGFTKMFSLLHQMILIIGYLIIGKLSLSSLAGPVGIYTVVEQSAEAGLMSLVYLVGFLSLNVGFINLLPIPAFDGGRILFLLIEKIKGSRVNPKVENTIHAIGFVFLMILMVLITYNDIMRLFF